MAGVSRGSLRQAAKEALWTCGKMRLYCNAVMNRGNTPTASQEKRHSTAKHSELL